MKYARDGWAWFSVITPSAFGEAELPIEEEDRTAQQQRKMQRLEALAETHGTHVSQCSYQRG